MNVTTLIDALMRQTTVLVAQLATTAGLRAPLAHLANQVFMDLVDELKGQGVSQRVIADMFGLALRSYQAKVRRLSQSRTERDRSLWEAILTLVSDQKMVLRDDILKRFSQDDPRVVASVLRDLSDSGLIFRSGRGPRTVFRAASLEEVALVDDQHHLETLAHLVWVVIDRLHRATLDDLMSQLPLAGERMDDALAWLLARGHIEVEDPAVVPKVYISQDCIIPFESPIGWEAAVLDHFQAMVTVFTSKLNKRPGHARREDTVGGSTYSFDMVPGHPLEERVLGLLTEVRTLVAEVREKDEAFWQSHAERDRDDRYRVVFYVGQAVLRDDADDDLDDTEL